MGAINFGINKPLVKKMAETYKIENFIETGTYLGETSAWAAGIFREVHTIEISEPLFKDAKEKYKNLSNMHVYLGDSRHVLPEIMDKIQGKSLFWLDGHWCGRNTGGKFNACPIMDELAQAVRTPDNVILIDDLRYFLGPNPHDYEENYPTLHSILQFLFAKLPDHFITFHDDTLICVPHELKPVVDQDYYDNYNKRHPWKLSALFSKVIWRIKNMDFTLEKNRGE